MNSMIDGCDPGIREAVRLLLSAEFPATDSGDGVTKGGDGSPYPHVWMVYQGQAQRDVAALALDLFLVQHPGLPVDQVVKLDPEDGDGAPDVWIVGVVGKSR